MSYDLLVFDPEVPPRDRDGFMKWFERLAEWGEGHDYSEPTETSDALRAWFMEMLAEFPAMNGSFATDDYDSPKVTGYTICRDAIYADFRWTVIDDAYREIFSLARKYRLGFFDVSADNGQVWLPDSADGLCGNAWFGIVCGSKQCCAERCGVIQGTGLEAWFWSQTFAGLVAPAFLS